MADGAELIPAEGSAATRTILFADIVDSTGILRTHGEEGGRELIVSCLAVMASATEECKGVVLDRIGDEIMCLFEEPDAAAHAAAQLQQRVSEGHAKGELGCPMRIRVGLEHGTITKVGGELYGTTIHAAKRLVDTAKAGQILTTKDTLEHLGPLRRRMERYFDSIVLKGMAGELDIHELLWDTSVTMVPTGRPRRRRAVKATTLDLKYGDVEVRVDANHPRVTLGRDTACTVRLDGNAVSRMHARIIWDRGKVRLEDVSTNGTCIETDCGTVHTLHHDGMEISGRGHIRCGCLGREEDAALVRYDCGEGEAPSPPAAPEAPAAD